MYLSLLPLHIRGVADLEQDGIILSCFQSAHSLLDTLIHELAHLFIRDTSHSQEWQQCYRSLGGRNCYHYNTFDSNIRQFADVGYMPNIGNISGIQNIYFD